MSRSIVIHPSAEVLAAAAAARLVTALADIQAEGRIPGLALTGGGVGIATLAALAASPARGAVDWRRVDIYWGDERFVPATDGERNELQARQALEPGIEFDPARVHPMAADGGEFGSDVDAAAQAYVATLAARGAPLDIVLLGMGPEGHVASVFPHSDALSATSPVIPVRNCPKPPPTRISLTLPAIRQAAQVWMLVAGAPKAAAVARAVAAAAEAEVPAAGAIGRERTLWLVDRAAAGALPSTSPPE